MGMKVRASGKMLISLLFLVLLGLLASCGKTSSSVGSGTGFLFVTTQGDRLVSSYTINLGTGAITANGKGVATGNTPSAIVLAPSGNALFVANSADNSISSYTVNADGTPTAAGNPTPTGTNPVGIAVDSGGKFLFVVNQGSNTISVFSISGTSLTLVGSPFPTGNSPSALAITPDAKFLYVANQVDATVTEYSVDPSGALSNPVLTQVIGTAAPSAVTIALTPNNAGEFLYVANAGSNNVSGFAICDQVVTSCNNPNTPDGSLTAVISSPFSAGTGPVSLAADPSRTFLYVVDKGSNQVSEYKISSGTGALSALSSPTISTGTTPVWLAVRAGTTSVKATGGTTDFLYVANMGSGVGSSSISVYAFDSTAGTLGVVGAAVNTGGQPSAIAVK